MKKFTDNPWFVELFSSKNQVNVYSECMIHTMHHNKNYAGVELSQEQIANAYLIASAPEMYKMLECHLLAWDNLYPSDIGDVEDINKSEFEAVHKFVNQTRQLLAKARGE